MELLFMSCTSILRKQDLNWILETSRKKAIQHVLSAIRLSNIRGRLQSDTDYMQPDLKETFRGFMQHFLDASSSYGKVYVGSAIHRCKNGGSQTKKDLNSMKNLRMTNIQTFRELQRQKSAFYMPHREIQR